MTMESMGLVDPPEPYELAQEAYYDGPRNTATGVKCAACKNHHATVADVRWCCDLTRELRAEAEAEAAAEVASELAYARALETRAERGTWFGVPGPLDEEPVW